jgi:hypothetical protein
MKTIGTLLAGIALTALPLHGQVVRHPDQHLRYNVALADGDIDKITSISVHLVTNAPATPDKPGAVGQFGGNCQKSSDPKVWSCDVTIPKNVADGDYRLAEIDMGTAQFGKSYNGDFHVPLVPIQNSNTFTPPSKVTVTEQP